MIKCPNCGNELPDGTLFCLNCFTSLAKKEVLASETAKKENRLILFLKSRQMKVALLCLLAVALISGGAAALKSGLKRVKTVSAESTTLVAVTNINGEAVTDKSGEIVTQAVVEVTDSNGEALTNGSGSKVYQAVVPVTNAGGESVTNKNGEQVFEIVTSSRQESSTETTTKMSIFDRLFNKDKQPTEGSSTATTEKPSNYESTTVTTTETTAPSTTESTTKATQPSTETTTQNTATADEDDFEYEIYNGYARILKYTGTDKNVVVPAKLGGVTVGYIGDYIYNDIETITFSSDLYAGLGYLKSKNLEAVYFNGASEYSSVDGVVFGGNTLLYYPIGKKDSNYVLPDFCNKIGQNSVKNNPYIKTFTISSDEIQYAQNLIDNFIGCTSLTAINVKNDMDNLKTVDGVLFYTDSILVGDSFTAAQFIYPAGKQSSYYEFPSEFKIYVGENSFCGNPYLKTVKFTSNIRSNILHVHNSNNRPKGLEKVYFLDNEDQHKLLSEGWNSWCFQQSGIEVVFY